VKFLTKHATPHPASAAAPARPADPTPGSHDQHFTLLGYDHGVYYYLPRASGQVVALRVDQHVEARLIGIVPDENFWMQEYGTKEGVSWRLARADLLRRQHAVGIYDPARIRGRGAWWDRDHAVVHVGDRLIINGKEHPLSHPSKYIYERGLPYPISYERPLQSSQSSRLIELCKLISWDRPINAYYLAGWVALAPIGGATEWRPHVWLTGPADSGKSWVVREIVNRILRGIAIGRQSCTTEPAIRGALSNGSLPVVFDEAESKTKTEKLRIDALVGLARAASTQDGDPIGKANPDGTTREITISSMFLFSSISYPITKSEDMRRITALGITRDGDRARFSKIQSLAAEVITDDFCARLPARSISMISTIRQNSRIFGSVISGHLKSNGLGQQYGALLAGAWSLFSNDIITTEAAKKWVDEQYAVGSWSEQSAQQDESDHTQCLSRIMQHIIKASGSHGMVDISVAELMHIAKADDDIRREWASDVLGRYGMRGDPDCMVISSTHSAIASILKDTPWERNWMRSLKNIPGASTTEQPVRFGMVRSRGVEIPYPSAE
jgi:putative DNA primase/helicase